MGKSTAHEQAADKANTSNTRYTAQLGLTVRAEQGHPPSHQQQLFLLIPCFSFAKQKGHSATKLAWGSDPRIAFLNMDDGQNGKRCRFQAKWLYSMEAKANGVSLKNLKCQEFSAVLFSPS